MGFCVKDDTKRSSVLDIKLLHGDLIVMHGAEIHKKYLVGNSPPLLTCGYQGLTLVFSIESSLLAIAVLPSLAAISS